MDKFSRTILFFLLFCVLIILQFQPATLDHEEGGQNVDQDHPEKPKLSESHIKVPGRKSKLSYMIFKCSFLHQIWRDREYDGVKRTFREAVEKNFGKSKETVEESAETAAKLVEEAIHKTTEKVKESSDSA
ncbi:hypothetical protein JHK85_021809 [Glycine max]|nr:hypothetical protein JHK85_021809 [Glycine max]KAG5025454.1 hypothetical protein JHK86_021368 [Glycine max]